MEFDAKLILKQQQQLETEREPYNGACQDIARLCLPRHATFNQFGDFGWANAQRFTRSPSLYDDHGVIALDRGAAAFENYVMPRGSYWQQIIAADPELMKLQHVAEWFESKTHRLFQLRNDPQSGFVQQTHESILSLLAFGAQSMWVDLRYDAWGFPVGLRYRSEHVGEIVIEEDYQGNVSGTRRRVMLSARLALQQFGPEKLRRCGKVMKALEKPETHESKFEFIHVIMANQKIDRGRADWRSMPFVGLWLSKADDEIFDVGGYRSRPRTYSRLDKAPGEKYGFGRGGMVLPELQACQDIKLDIMIASELNAQPALSLSDDAQDMMIRYGPGELNYGLIDDMGRHMAKETFAKIDTSEMRAELNEMHQVIDRAFFTDMFELNREVKTHVTAAEIMERSQEKGVLLSPLARQETEWFSPQLEREIELMARLGEFDDMPDEVREAGGAKQAVYDNPLNRMKQAGEVSGFMRLMEVVTSASALDPAVVAEMQKQYPASKWLPAIAQAQGVPARLRASDKEMAKVDGEQAQAAESQMLLEAMPALGKTAKDLSAAGLGAPGMGNGF